MRSNEIALKAGVTNYTSVLFYRLGKPMPLDQQPELSFSTLLPLVKHEAAVPSSVSVGEVERLSSLVVLYSEPLSPGQKSSANHAAFYSERALVLGVFGAPSPNERPDSRGELQFTELADRMRNIRFAKFVNTTSEVALLALGRSHQNISTDDGVVVVINRDRNSTHHVLNATSPSLEQAVTGLVAPLAGIYNATTRWFYDASGIPVVHCVVDLLNKQNANHVNYAMSRLARAGYRRPEFLFVLTDFADATAAFSMVTLPRTLRTYVTQHNRKYVLPVKSESFGPELNDALQMYRDGLIRPWVKSQAAPTDVARPGDGRVAEIVATTFAETVIQSPSTYIALLLYTPWCGHCKKLLPVFNSAAMRYKGQNDVLFAMIDAEENELPFGYLSQEYPTLYFSAPDDRFSPQKYEGERSEEAIIAAFRKFVQKHRPDTTGA